MTLDRYDHTFRCMGCEVRLLIEAADGGPDPAELGSRAERCLHHFDAALTRFDPASELSRLNADSRTSVPASALLRAAITAGLWAADRTGGLVDPTLLGAIENAGYRSSMADATPARLQDALAAAPVRRPAAADSGEVWREVRVDDAAGTISRPPGVRLDTGGFGKGLAADAVATMLIEAGRFAVDCAGDVAVGGRDDRPFEIEVANPLTGDIAHTVSMASGGIATSGLDRHVWHQRDGFAHHLLDPSCGTPAWTGLVGVTALGDSALEAETLAKAALLAGPDAGGELLGQHGGVLFDDDGRATIVDASPGRLRVTTGELAAFL